MIERFLFLLRTDRKMQLVLIGILLVLIIMVVIFTGGVRRDSRDEQGEDEPHIDIQTVQRGSNYWVEPPAGTGTYTVYIIEDYNKTRQRLEKELLEEGVVSDISNVRWVDLSAAWEREMRQQADIEESDREVRTS